MISHDIQGALEMADYMAMLYRGRIVFEGVPEKFRTTSDPLITSISMETWKAPSAP